MNPFEKPSHAGAALAAEFVAYGITREDVREARLRATRMARVADGLPADPVFATNAEFGRYIDAVCAPVECVPDALKVEFLLAMTREAARHYDPAGVAVFLRNALPGLTPAQRAECVARLPAGALLPPPAAIVFPRVAIEA